jgi:hypothetical protein
MLLQPIKCINGQQGIANSPAPHDHNQAGVLVGDERARGSIHPLQVMPAPWFGIGLLRHFNVMPQETPEKKLEIVFWSVVLLAFN